MRDQFAEGVQYRLKFGIFLIVLVFGVAFLIGTLMGVYHPERNEQ